MRRRRWRRLLVIVLSIMGVGIVGVGCAASCRPAWYVPSTLDQSRLKSDKHDLVNLLDEIGAVLNAGRSIDLDLGEDQLNRWITARSEWPFEPPPELDAIQYPQVSLMDGGRMRVGATIEWAGRPWVCSFTGRIELEGEELRVHWEALHVGALRVPRAWLMGVLGGERYSGDAAARLADDGMVVLPARGVWTNGKRPFQVRDLEIAQGVLRFSLDALRQKP